MSTHPDLAARLIERGQDVASAESLTGGALAEAMTSRPGASGYFIGGVVAYATQVKRSLLGVSAASVISAECAQQMAAGVRRLLGATWGVATTGVAGPDLQDGQPVGTVFIAVSGPVDVVRRFDFTGDRSAIRSAAVAAALDLVAEALDG